MAILPSASSHGTDYIAHYELKGAYKWKEHVFGIMSRNYLESGFENGAIELGWSFPLWNYPYLKGYIQYFTGYGESLIDYDQYVNRIGIGISALVGIALNLSTGGLTRFRIQIKTWEAFRLFLVPFCVSSFSALVKDKGFFLIIAPDP